jgi:DNA repair protein RadA
MAKEEKKKDMKDLTILPGIGEATAEKLGKTRFDNISAIATASPGQLMDVVDGLGEKEAKKAIAAAKEILDIGLINGLDLLEKRKTIELISTGCEALDGITGGGFETGHITECYGEFACGKTQIAHSLCVQTIKKFPEATVVFIDTENTFRPERIVDFAKGAELDGKEVLKHILVARAYNSADQINYAEKVDELISKQGKKVKLVIIDSITAHFRAEYICRAMLGDRQCTIGTHLNTLTRLADTHNLAVYVTNQVMADPGMFFGDPTKAAGGHRLAHATGIRIYLRKGKKGCRVAKIIDAPHLVEAECSFHIETGGFTGE